MLRKSSAVLFLLILTTMAGAQTAERHFKFHYAFTVRNVTPGQELRVWIPLAHSDDFQDVHVLAKSGDLPLSQTTEKEFGNEMLYAESKKADRSEYHFAVDYDVVRHERVAGVGDAHAAVRQISAQEKEFYLRPDKLVPVTGLPAQLAAEQVKGKSGE